MEKLLSFQWLISGGDYNILVDGDVCATQSGLYPTGKTKVFPCDRQGMVVRIQLIRRNYLVLCEVEVFGSKYCGRKNCFPGKCDCLLLCLYCLLRCYYRQISFDFKISYQFRNLPLPFQTQVQLNFTLKYYKINFEYYLDL